MTHNPADRSSNPPTTTLADRLVEKAPMFEAASNAYVLTLRNPDGPQAAQAIQSLQDRVKALEGAIEPFAKAAKHFATTVPDGKLYRIVYWVHATNEQTRGEITAGDLRRAAAVKDGKTQNKESPGVGQGKEGEG